MKVSLKKKAQSASTEWWKIDYFQNMDGRKVIPPVNFVLSFFESRNFVLREDFVLYGARFFLNRKSPKYVEMIISKIPTDSVRNDFLSFSMAGKVSEEDQKKMDDAIARSRGQMGQAPKKTEVPKQQGSVTILERNMPPPTFSSGKEWQEIPLIPIAGMQIDFKALIKYLSEASYKVFEDFIVKDEFYVRSGSGVIPLIQEAAGRKMFGIESVGMLFRNSESEKLGIMVDIMFVPLLFKYSNDKTIVNIKDLSFFLTVKFPNGFRVRDGILYICLTFSLIEDVINELNAYASMGIYGIFGVSIPCPNSKIKEKLETLPIFMASSKWVRITESASSSMQIGYYIPRMSEETTENTNTSTVVKQKEDVPTIAPEIDRSVPLWMDISYMTTGSIRVNVFSLGDSLKNAGFEIGKDYNVVDGILSVNRNSPKFKEITKRFDEWVRNEMWGLTKIRTDEDDKDEYQRNPAQQLFKIIPKSQLKPGEQDIRDAFANKCIEDLEAANLDVFYLSGQIYYKLEDAEKVEKIVQKYDTGLGNYLSVWKANPNSPNLPPLFNKVIDQEVAKKIELLNAQTEVKTAKEFVRSPDSPYNGIPLTDKDIAEIGVGIKQFEDSFKANAKVKFVDLSPATKMDIVNKVIQEKQMIPGYFASIFAVGEGYSGVIVEISRNVSSYDKLLDLSMEYGLDIEEYSSYRDTLNRDDSELSYVYQRLLKQNSMNTYTVNRFLSQAYFEIIRPVSAQRDQDKAYEIVGSFVTYIIFEYIERLSKTPIFSGTEESDNKMKKVLRATNKLLYQTFMDENYATRLAKNIIKDPVVFLSKYQTIENAKKSLNYQEILKIVANDVITFAEANRYKVTSGNTSKEYYLYEEPEKAIPILKNTFSKEVGGTIRFIQMAEYNKAEELIGWKTVFTE